MPEDKITSFASVAEVFSLRLEQVFHNSLEFEALYLMTLLVGLVHCAHTIRKIRFAAGGCIKKGASFGQAFKLVYRSDWLHTHEFRW